MEAATFDERVLRERVAHLCDGSSLALQQQKQQQQQCVTTKKMKFKLLLSLLPQ